MLEITWWITSLPLMVLEFVFDALKYLLLAVFAAVFWIGLIFAGWGE